jgi:L-lactate dehydrogenase (cytochrome)
MPMTSEPAQTSSTRDNAWMGAALTAPAPLTGARRFHDMLALQDFESAARSFLPKMIYGFISGSAETGAAKHENTRVYADYALVPRVLRDVSQREHSKSVLGRRYSVPFGIAPIGGAAIAAYRGDLALAEAAKQFDQPVIMSASSLIRLEDIRRCNPAAWFQAYLAGDVARIDAMIDRVAAAGFETLVVTVDTPVPGNRENNVRSGYSMPIRITPRVAFDCLTHPRWLFGTFFRTLYHHGMPHFENMDAVRGPPMMSRNLVRNLGDRDQLTWQHLARIRERWRGKLVIKGLLAADDVAKAREFGADGVILSNHGGRQLDHAIAPLHILRRIRRENKDLTIIIDGGIRRGTDVLKALILGADFVLVGRPFICAAAVGGVDGVLRASQLLAEEIHRDMAMLGVCSLSELGPQLIARLTPAFDTADSVL